VPHLFDAIRSAVAAEQFALTDHADNRLRERNIELWQVIGEIDNAWLIAERPADLPNPSVELQLSLPDGTPVKVIWAWVEIHRLALLVTVHYLDDWP
jgi:hypothetical protein